MLDKIKTLEQLTAKKLERLGISFKEYAEALPREIKLKLFWDQIHKHSERFHGILRVSSGILQISDTLNNSIVSYCENNYDFTPDNSDLDFINSKFRNQLQKEVDRDIRQGKNWCFEKSVDQYSSYQPYRELTYEKVISLCNELGVDISNVVIIRDEEFPNIRKRIKDSLSANGFNEDLTSMTEERLAHRGIEFDLLYQNTQYFQFHRFVKSYVEEKAGLKLPSSLSSDSAFYKVFSKVEDKFFIKLPAYKSVDDFFDKFENLLTHINKTINQNIKEYLDSIIDVEEIKRSIEKENSDKELHWNSFHIRSSIEAQHPYKKEFLKYMQKFAKEKDEPYFESNIQRAREACAFLSVLIDKKDELVGLEFEKYPGSYSSQKYSVTKDLLNKNIIELSLLDESNYKGQMTFGSILKMIKHLNAKQRETYKVSLNKIENFVKDVNSNLEILLA